VDVLGIQADRGTHTRCLGKDLIPDALARQVTMV
jgi:hypothetical protein